MTHPDRNRELARIHVLKKQLGLDDDTYRTVLHVVARVESARDLDAHGRRQVIQQLESRLPAGERRGQVAPHKARQVAKIRALLIHAPGGRRQDAYADAMAQHMFGVERFAWCEPAQLHKLIAALMVDLGRHAKP